MSGDGQEAPVGSSLPDFLVVRVTLGATQPAEGVLVEWAVLGGGAELSRKGPRTNGQGLAAVVVFLIGEPGERTVRASLETGAEVRFTARVLGAEPPPVPPVPADRGPRTGT